MKFKNNRRIDVNKIRKLVSAQGVSLASISRKIGLTKRQYFHNRLTRLNPFKADELIRLSEVLGVKVEELALPEGVTTNGEK